MKSRLSTTMKKKPIENIEGKGENAGNQHFLLFPQCFLNDQIEISASDLNFVNFKSIHFGPSILLSFGNRLMFKIIDRCRPLNLRLSLSVTKYK